MRRSTRTVAAAWLGAALLASVAAGCGSGPVGTAVGSADVVAGDETPPGGATASSAGGAGTAGGAGSVTADGTGTGTGGSGLAATVGEPGPIDLSGRPVKITGSNSTPNEVDRYTFTGSARQRISVEVVKFNEGCTNDDRWSFDIDILGPDDQPLRNGKQYAGIGGCQGYGPWTLPADGTYTLTFTSEKSATGSYTAIAARLADTGTTIDLSAPAVVTGTIDVALDSRRFSFQGNAGDRISAEVNNLNGTCETADRWALTIDIVDETNQQVRRSSPGYAGIGGCSGYGPWTLPTAGTYTATFTSDDAGKGTFKATLARLARTATPVDLSRPVTVEGSIDVALDSRSYTFAATKGQKISVQVTALNGACDRSSAWDLDVNLISPDGEKVGSAGYAGITGCTTFDPWTVPANGDYAITFSGEGRDKGSWKAVLTRA